MSKTIEAYAFKYQNAMQNAVDGMQRQIIMNAPSKRFHSLVAYCTDTAGNRWWREVGNFRTPAMRVRARTAKYPVGLLASDSADSTGNEPGGETDIDRNFLCFHDMIPFCRDFCRQNNEAWILRKIQSKFQFPDLKAA